MKLIDKNGKLFGKLNIIDLVVVLLIIAAIVFIGMRLTGGHESSSLKTAEYTFKIERVRKQTVDAWTKNAVGIVDAENKDHMGDIIAISYEPARVFVKKSDGTYAIAEHTDRYDVTLTLTVGVNETDEGYYTENNTYIAPGKDMGLSNRYAQSFGVITGLTIK